MRGDDFPQAGMFSYISPEERVPHDHPLRLLRQMVDHVLVELSPEFDRLYARTGRPSVPGAAAADSWSSWTTTCSSGGSWG